MKFGQQLALAVVASFPEGCAAISFSQTHTEPASSTVSPHGKGASESEEVIMRVKQMDFESMTEQLSNDFIFVKRDEDALGKGSFGTVYWEEGDLCLDGKETCLNKKHIDIWVKVEQWDARKKLKIEAGYLAGLTAQQTSKGNWVCSVDGRACYPSLYQWYEAENGDYIAVMEALGLSLEVLRKDYTDKGVLSTDLVFKAWVQQIQILDQTHNTKVVDEKTGEMVAMLHRDIKPDNWLTQIGFEDEMSQHEHNPHHAHHVDWEIRLIDFGLSYKIDGLKRTEHHKLVGSPRYASLNTHAGINQSRRDDLESAGYVMMYLLKGFLPWQGLQYPQGPHDTPKWVRNEIIGKKKRSEMMPHDDGHTGVYDVCVKGLALDGKDYTNNQKVKDGEDGYGYALEDGVWKVFEQYFSHVLNLEFDDIPDYKFLESLFVNYLNQHKQNKQSAATSALSTGLDAESEWISVTESASSFSSTRARAQNIQKQKNNVGFLHKHNKYPWTQNYSSSHKDTTHSDNDDVVSFSASAVLMLWLLIATLVLVVIAILAIIFIKVHFQAKSLKRKSTRPLLQQVDPTLYENPVQDYDQALTRPAGGRKLWMV